MIIKPYAVSLLTAAGMAFAAPVFAGNWQSPDSYVRSPSGSTPSNQITLTAEFDDETNCAHQTYRFWVFDGSGTPLYGLGPNTALASGEVTQTITIPPDVAVEAIHLACTDAWGNRVDSSGALESGSPAFTPQGGSAAWDDPVEYRRFPTGSTIDNPVTFSAMFDDETGCTNQTYRFWIYDDENNPVAGIGSNVALNGGRVEQMVSLPNNVGIEAIRLACTNSNGSLAGASGTLESGSPSFTPFSDLFLVAEGGTGSDTFTTNGVLFGDGASPIRATAAGSAYQVLRVPSGGGAPSFGALDISQAVAVTGTLPVTSGGTGSATAFTVGSVVFAGSSGVYAQDNANLFWNDSTNRLGVGTSTPIASLEVVGTIASNHLKGTGVTPSIAAGTGAGTGGTVTISGTDSAGFITVDAGLLPASNATVATVTFASAYDTTPYVVLYPASPTAALLSGLTMVHVTGTASTFRIVSGTTGILTSGVVSWNYHVIE